MNTIKVKIKKVHENAVIPTYAKDGDACLDLTSTSINIVDEGQFGYIEFDSGLAVEIPKGFVGKLYPRSSISNTGLIMSNSVGVIDSGYRGTIKARFKAIPNTRIYEVGERFAQLEIVPIPTIEWEEVEELSETERGTGSYGSTGN